MANRQRDADGLGAQCEPFNVRIRDSALAAGRNGAAPEAAVKEGHVLGSQHKFGEPWALEEHKIPGPAKASPASSYQLQSNIQPALGMQYSDHA